MKKLICIKNRETKEITRVTQDAAVFLALQEQTHTFTRKEVFKRQEKARIKQLRKAKTKQAFGAKLVRQGKAKFTED